MITFVPNFANLNLDDALKAQLNNVDERKFDVNIDASKSEFIFILDRSGSMSDKRIKKAKEALIFFL